MPSYEPDLPKAGASKTVLAADRDALAAELRNRIAVCLNLAQTTGRPTAQALREIARNAELELSRLIGDTPPSGSATPK